MVEILAGGAVAARRQDGRGRGADKGAHLTVVEEPVYSSVESETRWGVSGDEG